MFITFEGIDGCGKSTQLNLLGDYLQGQGYDVIRLREPGGTKLSEDIREILLSNKSQINDMAELLLFESARANLVESVIKPALEKNAFVLCDRFYDSTTAYQGFGRQLDLKKVEFLNHIATNGLKPDLTFYLKISINTAKTRSSNRKHDRIEKAGDSFFERVMQGFEYIASIEPDRFIIIDAENSAETTKNRIIKNIPYLKDYN